MQVSNPCIDKLVWKFSDYLLQITSKKKYTDMALGKTSNFLNTLLHELSANTPHIILITLFHNINTRHTMVEFPQKIIPYLITERKYAKYTIFRTSIFSVWNNLRTAKHAAPNLGRIWSICIFQIRWLSIPRNFVLIISSKNLSAYSTANWACNEFLGVNFTKFVFSNLKLTD
jgi:hypothetical protein